MSKIIGTCLGEYIKEEDVFYDPQKDIYKIKAGDRLIEIPGYELQSENLRTLQEALSNVDDRNIKIDMLGSWAKARSNPIDYTGEAKTAVEIAARTAESMAAAGSAGATFDSQSQDPLHARVRPETYDSSSALDKRFEQPWKVDGLGASVRPVDSGDWSIRYTDKAAEKLRAGSASQSSIDLAAQDQNLRQGIWSSFAGGRANGKSSTASQTTTPWGDPLKSQADMSSNTIACMDLPEPRPDYNPNEQVQVYYHDRFPSIPIRSIIDDALELLNEKKNLHISKISFIQSNPDFRLTISSLFPTNVVLRKTLEVLINHAAFDRAYKTDLDKYAGLKARLDTNTYIKLRIAFLLYQALKLRDEEAKKISLDIFKIIGSETRPDLHI